MKRNVIGIEFTINVDVFVNNAAAFVVCKQDLSRLMRSAGISVIVFTTCAILYETE